MDKEEMLKQAQAELVCTDRNTKFAGFANLLWQELKYNCPLKVVGNALVIVPADNEVAETIIAQRAYDLAEHVINLIPQLIQAFPDLQTATEAVNQIPDLTELPEYS